MKCSYAFLQLEYKTLFPQKEAQKIYVSCILLTESSRSIR